MRVSLYGSSVFIPDGLVSSTIFLPLVARALESEKRNSLLTDRKAVEIYNRIRDVNDLSAAAKDDLRHYAIICRTICFDRLISDFIWRYPSGTIVNIGCGLETTLERLDASSVQWYDIDLPEVIELRSYFFSETEKRKFISTSFLSNEWLGEINCNDSMLIYASGVFYYYNEAVIRRFFNKLSNRFSTCELLFDVTSPMGARAANNIIRKAGMRDGPFLKWGLEDYRSILEWNPRMKILGNYRLFNKTAGRIPLKCFIPSLISDVFSMENILHLKIRYDYRKLGTCQP